MASKKTRKRVRLGELLIENNLITEEQLKTALAAQKQTGQKLGGALVSLGYIKMRDIHKVLEYQLGIPYIRLKETVISQEAVSLLNETVVRQYGCIPFKLEGDELYVAMEDPLNIYAIDEMALISGKVIVPALADEVDVRRAIDRYYGNQQAIEAADLYSREIQEEEREDSESEEAPVDMESAPIVKVVTTIIEQAARFGASDIHIEPFEKIVKVRFRVDGRLKTIMEYDEALMTAISARVKIISGMDISEKRKPQDGRTSMVVDGKTYDIRVSIIPTVYGEKVVMRIAYKDTIARGKQEIGLEGNNLEKFNSILQNPHGIILVTGPTGSGKSTTVYTALSELNSDETNIITVEDPVEYNIQGINQVQVNPKADLTFANALRSILRQDPDIIMIGEIRDQETAGIAVKASITGHLVISTLHTNDAASSITRLIDMGVEPYLISASVVGVIAQRLIRLLCPNCREAYSPDVAEREILDIRENEDVTIYKAHRDGCPLCNYTGYKGRTAVYEIMPVTPAIRKLISHNDGADEIKLLAVTQGMDTLKVSTRKFVMDGRSSMEEMIRTTYEIV